MVTALIIIFAVVAVVALGICILYANWYGKDLETYQKEYNKWVKYSIIAGVVLVCAFGLLCDVIFGTPTITMEELNDNPAWHNWLAGGIFAVVVGLFAWAVYRKFKK